ncbi:MAG: hypothetical protein RLZ98_3390, partial [Pseudomonadota bacterium]
MNTRNLLARIGAALIIYVASSLAANAQSCSFSMPSFNFGNIDLTQNTTFDLTGTLTVSCTGNPGQTIRYCPNINSGSGGAAGSGDPRFMLNGANQLSYNIYKDAGFSQFWGSYTGAGTPPLGTVNLNGSGFGSDTMTVRVRINAGQTGLPTGMYLSSFGGGQTSFTYSYPFFGLPLCAIFTGINATQAPFTVQANNTGTCTVSATDLNFGSIGLLSGNNDGTNALTVNCTSGLSYQVGLNGGLTGASDPTQRKMTLGVNEIIYGLYRDAARTMPWGSTIGSNTVAGTGSGGNQSLTVYGRIPPQATPPPGTYSDM